MLLELALFTQVPFSVYRISFLTQDVTLPAQASFCKAPAFLLQAAVRNDVSDLSKFHSRKLLKSSVWVQTTRGLVSFFFFA